MATNPLYKIMKRLTDDEEESIVNQYDDGSMWTLPQTTTSTDYSNPLVYSGSSSSNPLFDLINQAGTADPNYRDMLEAPRNQMNYYTGQLNKLGVEPVAPETGTSRTTIGDIVNRITAIPATLENTMAGYADSILKNADEAINAYKEGDILEGLGRSLTAPFRGLVGGVKSGANTAGSLINPELRDKAVDYGTAINNVQESDNLKAIGDVIEAPGYGIAKAWGALTPFEVSDEQAAGFGNLVGDIGLSMLSGNVTDIDGVGKAIKYLNKADEIDNIAKVAGNMDEAINLAKKAMSKDDYIRNLDNMARITGKNIKDFDVDKMYDNFVITYAKNLEKSTNKALGGINDFKGITLGNGKVLVSKETLKSIADGGKLQRGLTKAGLSIYSPLGAVMHSGTTNKVLNAIGETKAGKKATELIEDNLKFGKNNEWAQTARKAYKEGRYDEVLLDMSMKGESALNKRIRQAKELWTLNVSKDMRKIIDDESAEKITYAMEGQQEKVKEYVEEEIVNDEYIDAIINKVQEKFNKYLEEFGGDTDTLSIEQLTDLDDFHNQLTTILSAVPKNTVEYKKILKEMNLPDLDPKYFTDSLTKNVAQLTDELSKDGIDNAYEVAVRLKGTTEKVLENIENASPELKGRFKGFKLFDFGEDLNVPVRGYNYLSQEDIQKQIKDLKAKNKTYKEVEGKDSDVFMKKIAQLEQDLEVSKLSKEAVKVEPSEKQLGIISGEKRKPFKERLAGLEDTVSDDVLDKAPEVKKRFDIEEDRPTPKGTEHINKEYGFFGDKVEITDHVDNVKSGRISAKRDMIKEELKSLGIEPGEQELADIDLLADTDQVNKYKQVLFHKSKFNNTVQALKDGKIKLEESGLLHPNTAKMLNNWMTEHGYEETGDIQMILETMAAHRAEGEETFFLNYATKDNSKKGKFTRLANGKAGKRKMTKADQKAVNLIRNNIMEESGENPKMLALMKKIEQVYEDADKAYDKPLKEVYREIKQLLKDEGIKLTPPENMMVKNWDIKGLRHVISEKYKEKYDNITKHMSRYEADLYYDLLNQKKLPPVSEATKDAYKLDKKQIKEFIEKGELDKAIDAEGNDLDEIVEKKRKQWLAEQSDKPQAQDYAGDSTEDLAVEAEMEKDYNERMGIHQRNVMAEESQAEIAELYEQQSRGKSIAKELEELDVKVDDTTKITKEIQDEIDEGLDELQGKRIPEEFEGTVYKSDADKLNEEIKNAKIFEPKTFIHNELAEDRREISQILRGGLGTDYKWGENNQLQKWVPGKGKSKGRWVDVDKPVKEPKPTKPKQIKGQTRMNLAKVGTLPDSSQVNKVEPKTFIHNEVVEPNEFGKQFPTLEYYTTHKYSGQKYYYSDFDKAPKYVIADDGTKLWKPFDNNPGMEHEEWSNNIVHDAIRSKKRPELKPEDMKNPERVKQVEEAQRIYDNYLERLKSVEIEYSPSNAQYNIDYNRYQNNPLTKVLLEQQEKLREEQYNMNRYNMEPKTDLSILEGQQVMDLDKAGTLPDSSQVNKVVPKDIPRKVEPDTPELSDADIPKDLTPEKIVKKKQDGQFLGYEFEVDGARIIIDDKTPIEDIKKIFTREMIAENYIYTPKLVNQTGLSVSKGSKVNIFMNLSNISEQEAKTIRLHEDGHSLQTKLARHMVGGKELVDFMKGLPSAEKDKIAKLVSLLEMSGQRTSEAMLRAKDISTYTRYLRGHGVNADVLREETDAIVASLVLNPNPNVKSLAEEIFGEDLSFKYVEARMKVSKDNIPFDQDFIPSRLSEELRSKLNAAEKAYTVSGGDKEKFYAIKGMLDSISDSSEAQSNAEVLLSKLEQYRDIDPEGFEEAVKGLDSHIKIFSEVEKIIDIDMTKDFTKDEIKVFNDVRDYFMKFGKEEGIIKPGEEQLFTNYVFHSLNPKYKMDKDAQRIARERWGEGFTEVFNANALERRYKGKISELNASFKQAMEEEGKQADNLFETNIIDIFTKRSMNNAKTMYEKRFQDGFIEKFGMENVTNWGERVNTADNAWELMQKYVPEDLMDDSEALTNLMERVKKDYEKSNKTLYQFLKEDTPKYTGKTINDWEIKDYSQEAFAKRATARRFGLQTEYGILDFDPITFDENNFKLVMADESVVQEMYKEKLRVIETMKARGLTDKSWTDHRALARKEGKVFVDNAMIRMEAEEIFANEVHHGLLDKCPKDMDIAEFKRIKRQEIRRNLREQYKASNTHHYAYSDIEVNNQGAYKDMMWELAHSDDYVMVEFMGNKKYTKANTIGEGVNPDEIDGMDGEDLSNYRVVEKSQIRKQTLVNQESKQYLIRKDHWDNYKKEVERQKKAETNAFIKAYDAISNKFKTQALASGRFVTNSAFGNIFESYMTSGVNLLNPKMIKQYIDYRSGKDIDIGGYNALEIKSSMEMFGGMETETKNIYEDVFYKKAKGIVDDPTKQTPLTKMWDKTGAINPLNDEKFLLYKGVRGLQGGFEEMSRFINVATHLQNGDDMATAIHKTTEALFDYSELTDFEEKWMKRIIPFYTFMRKNMPLQLQNLADNPARYSRLYNGYEEANDTFNSEKDQKLRPKYLDNALAVGNNKFLNLPNPVNDLEKLINPYELTQGVNPMIKTPLELLTNTRMYSGGKVSQYNDPMEKLEYGIKSVLPLVNQIESIISGAKEGNYTPLVNFLGIPYKTFDKDKAEQQTMYEYVTQLEQQYYKYLEDNPGAKEYLESLKNKKTKKTNSNPLNKMLR